MLTARNAVSRVAATLALAAGLLASATAQAQNPIVLKFGNQTQNDVQHEYMKLFKAKLEAASQNKIRVDLFPASQLGPFPRQIEGLRLGNIQALIGPLEFFVGVDPSFQVTSMAGLFRDEEHVYKVLSTPAFKKVMSDIGDKRGVVPAAYMAYGMQLFAFKGQTQSLADAKGRRVRVLASEAEQAAVQALGMASIPMPLPEVLPALQQGTIDGVSTGLTIFTSLRYYDAAPNAVDSKLWGILTGVIFSKEWMGTLPTDLRKTVVDTAQSLEAEIHAWNTKNLKDAREIWTKNGGKMATLSAADQADAAKKVFEATNKVLDKYPPVKATYEQIKKIADGIK